MPGAKLGAGREADVYAWGADAVVKLYRPGFGGHRAEAQALAALDGHGVAPRLIESSIATAAPAWCSNAWTGWTC